MISLENLQKKTSRSFFIQCLIEDDNYEYVDFSDYLMSKPTIKNNVDARYLSSRYVSSTSSIQMNNADRFWDKPLPTNLKTIEGNAAVFSNTKNASYSVLLNHRIQFRLIETHTEQQYRENILGTFLIDDIDTDLAEKAEIKLAGLEKQLMEKDASEVKNGQSWYQNRTISFLVKKLLEPVFGSRNNSQIPSTFTVPAWVNQPTNDETRTLSTIGNPPQFTDTDDDGVGNIYYEKNIYTRAMTKGPSDLSTLTSKSNSDDYDTLYIGSNESLYKYNPITDVYTLLGNTASGYYIRDIWINKHSQRVYLVASKNMTTDTTVDANQWYGVRAFLYYYNGSRLTEESEISTLAYRADFEDFNDGKRYYRNGLDNDSGSQFLGLLGDSDTQFGPNVLANYSQYIRCYNTVGTKAALSYEKADSNDATIGADGTILVNGTPLPGNIHGYNVIYNSDLNNPGYKSLQARFSFGQDGVVCFNDAKTINYPNGALLFSKFYEEGKNIYSKLYLYKSPNAVVTEIDTTYSVVLGGSTQYYQPICAAAIDDASFYVVMLAFNESDSSSYDSFSVKYFRIDYAGETIITSIQNAPSKEIPISLYYSSVTRKLVSVILNYTFCSDSESIPMYRIRYGSISLSPSTHSSIHTSYNQPKGVIYYGHKLWFVLQQTGTLNYINLSDSPYSFTTEDTGFPIVDGAYYLQTKLIPDMVSNPDKTIFWGIASSVFDDQMVQESNVQTYLFKHDAYISEHVDLADFSNLSLWNALGLLAQRSNCLMGFTEAGNFFFKRRQADDNTAYTIEDGIDNIYSIKKGSGRDNIFNFVELTPYILEYKQPEYNASLQKRTTAEEATTIGEDEIELKQIDTLTKKIELYCTYDGDANIGASKISGFPRFKFGVYDPVITTRLAQDTTNSRNIFLSSVFGGNNADFGIKTGYYVFHTDIDENEYYSEIVSVDEDTNTIVVSSSDQAITGNVNDELKIYKRASIGTTSRFWSDDGVTFLSSSAIATKTLSVNSLTGLSVGTFVDIGGFFGIISSIDSENNTITLTAESNNVTASSGDIVKAWFAPRVYTNWYEIGSTNVYMKFNTNSATIKTIFKQGDRISIECDGFKLVADSNSKQTAVNTDSITKYGKQQFKTINNRFFTRKIAQLFARLIRTNWAWPKHTFSITMSLANYIEFLGSTNLSKIVLRSSRLLPYREGYSEECYVTSIQHNTQAGQTTLELQAINPY